MLLLCVSVLTKKVKLSNFINNLKGAGVGIEMVWEIQAYATIRQQRSCGYFFVETGVAMIHSDTAIISHPY